MEHVYTVDTKIIQGKVHYFVKKIMLLPEFKGVADIVIGYGMHTSFEKACSIANVHDDASRQLLLLKLEELNKPQKPAKLYKVKIADTVNHWSVKHGAEILN